MQETLHKISQAAQCGNLCNGLQFQMHLLNLSCDTCSAGPFKVPEDAGVTWMWGNQNLRPYNWNTEVPIGTQVFVNWKSCAMG